MNEFIRFCAKNNIKTTTVRKQLYVLLSQNSPILASEFISLAKQNGFDSVSVYRTINLFIKYGLVFEFGFGKQKTLQLHEPDGHSHHHYIRCVNCDRVARFEDNVIEKQLLNIANSKDFATVSSHYLEIMGTCNRCYQLERTA